MASTKPPVHYGFSRDTSSVPLDYAHLADTEGVGGVVFNADDPHFASQYLAARNAGLPVGIWIPATSDGGDPKAYAQRMAALSAQFHPDVLVPDIEFGGKGGPGTAGWQWNQTVAETFHALDPNTQVAVSVMPNQDDFNYKAWTGIGSQVWGQSYGANPATDQVDPQDEYNRLIANGVPPELAQVVLAPGQDAHGVGNYSIYTLDDLNPQQKAQLLAMSQQTGVPPEQLLNQIQEPTSAPTPDAAPQAQPVKDAANPAAVAYAKQRLALLAKQGYTPQQYGLEGLDPTAQWRAMSSIVGATQAISSGHAADYHVSPSAPAPVADYINKLLAAATGPDTQGPDDAIRPGQVPSLPVTPRPLATATGVHAARPAAAAPTPGAVGRPETAPITPAGHLSAAAAQALTDIKRNPAGELAPAMQRIGPMQQAIHTAAAVKFLRNTPTTAHPGVE